VLSLRGGGGRLFLASDALALSCALSDCGDGWTWACPDESRLWWLSASFLVDGVPVEPESVALLAGRVSFARCLRGREVVASGVCRPTTVAASSESWRLSITVPLSDSTGIADGHRTVESGTERSASAVLEGASVERWLADSLAGQDVLVHLPYRKGLIVGAGRTTLSPDTNAVSVVLNEGAVSYVG
jgi:hypothetical protein